jgi:hypothetical protein
MHSALAQRPELTPLFDELRVVAGKLATLSFATRTPERAAEWQRQIGELSAQKEALEARLASASREYREAQKPVTLADVQAALPEGGTLVDFLVFGHPAPQAKEKGGGITWERRLAAFIVRKGKPVELVDLGAVQPVGVAIEAWRKWMETPKRRAGRRR